ncbi:hypothetical protein [Megamonas funiformis]|uniref:hypothetical protein n=1 Tax=Megamonas funiformis TaxID=437897 RepID=UPI002941E977|nr:hypothetical protein [Megamonas funiformis]
MTSNGINYITLPISFNKKGYVVVATDIGEGCQRIGCSINGLTQIKNYCIEGYVYGAWYIVLGV